MMPSVFSVVSKYQDILRPSVTFNFSAHRHVFGNEGIPNRHFIFTICGEKEQFHSFLREVGLIKTEFSCPKCNSVMKIKPDKRVTDGFVWICRDKTSGKVCGCTRSVRDSSLFKASKLTMEEIFLLTYELIRGEKSRDLMKDYSFNEHTIVDWRRFIQEKMWDYIESKSEKIGGVGKIVEINESKFGKRKCNKGHAVEGHCVFGGVERETGRLFLVTVNDRSPETLVGVVEKWIEKGTVIYSNGLASCEVLGEIGYDNLTVNHSVTFVDPVKNKFSRNRHGKFDLYLAQYMFEKSCAWKNEYPFNKFLEIVVETNWDEFVFHRKNKEIAETKNG